MKNAHWLMDGLSLHYYTIPGTWQAKGSSVNFEEAEWFETLRKALLMDELITKHSTIMDRYDPEKRVGLIVDEWGTWYDVIPGTEPGFCISKTPCVTLVAGIHLNIFHKHCQRVQMANLAQMVNVLQAVILTKEEEMILTPTYHVLRMFNVHQDAQSLPLQLTTGDYSYKGQQIPAVSASASKDGTGKIHISLCNLNPNEAVEITCSLRGAECHTVSGEILTAENINDYNDFEAPERIVPRGFSRVSFRDGLLNLVLPSKSVLVLRIEQ